jgi:predicted nucleotidyltransferase
MDFRTPVETMIPGATGRLLAALARVDTELPVSTLARVAGVGRTRASGLVAELSSLGLVDRREIGRTTMVRLARDNAAGQLVDRLGHLQSVVVDQLRLMATELDPAPLSLLVFGSFARGEATSDSDIDVLAVRPTDVDSDRWADAVATFATKARRLTGNPVQVLDYDLDELRRRARPRAKTGRAFWEALRRDSLVLAGTSVGELLTDTHVASR